MIDRVEYPYWIALGGMSGIFTRRKNEIIIRCCYELGHPLSALFRATSAEKFSVYNLNETEQALFHRAMDDISKFSYMAEDLLEQGFGIIPVFDRGNYPNELKRNLGKNSPVVLYCKGDVSILNQECVAIVGSRKASQKSLDFTDSVAKLAVEQNRPTVSGYAAGIDRQALDSAIKYGGKSIVVLPQGILTFGTGFRSLYREIITGNVIVTSAFYPTAPWSRELAMARNPIIYALAKEIFVAESSDRGGTFSGVENGLKKKRTIFVRNPESNENNANNLLIQMGCVPVNSEGVVLSVFRDETKCSMSEDDVIKEKIVVLLKQGKYNSKDIVNHLRINWTSNKVSRVIMTIPNVNKSKIKGLTYYSILLPEPRLL